MLVRIVSAIFLASPVATAQAHGLAGQADESRLPLIVNGLLLAIFWLIYCLGTRKIPPGRSQFRVFHGTCLLTALISIGLLDDWLETGSATHMIQHMLLLVVIAPLFVLARPLPQWMAASGRTGSWLCKPLLRLGRYPMWASCLQAVVIWFWHAPKFYNLALASPWWHFIEHVCLALGAGMFWWSVLTRNTAAALPALLFTMMHTGMLGALLAFAQTPLYGDLHDLQDQQLAGLIMWVPGGLPYLIAGIWCSLRWFRKSMRAVSPGV